MDDRPKILSPAEAFRVILRPRLERPALADEIAGWAWFHRYQDLTVKADSQSHLRPLSRSERHDFVAALRASRKLSKLVSEGKIRLRGEAPGDRFPRDIDFAHAE